MSQVDFIRFTREETWLLKGFYEESKRSRYEGTFEHGNENGKFQFSMIPSKAKSIATREFSTKDNAAYTIFFDQANNKVSEGCSINCLRALEVLPSGFKK
jgi:hypothetical protein